MRFSKISIILKLFYSTSRPSGNQVDGLPLVLHTRAVLVSFPLGPALSDNNWQKMYCESWNSVYMKLKWSEQIQDSIKIMRFYGLWAQGDTEIEVSIPEQWDILFSCFLNFAKFWFFQVFCKLWLINCSYKNEGVQKNKIISKLFYSTSRPSGNQVDGLPLVLHNTRAVL